MSLNNLGVRLSETGSREEALAATREAVDLFRPLAKQHSRVFVSNLDTSLRNFSRCLNELGRTEEAQAALKEAEGLST